MTNRLVMERRFSCFRRPCSSGCKSVSSSHQPTCRRWLAGLEEAASSKAVSYTDGHAVPVKIPRGQVRFFQAKLVAQVRPPILVKLRPHPETRAIIRKLFVEGPAKFLCEIDGQIRLQIKMRHDG